MIELKSHKELMKKAVFEQFSQLGGKYLMWRLNGGTEFTFSKIISVKQDRKGFTIIEQTESKDYA